MAEPQDGSGEWLTLSAATSRLGWHLQRVQSKARRDEWPKRRPNRGSAMEYLVPASLLTAPAAEAATEPDGAADGAAAELVTLLTERAARAEGELAAERRRSHDLAALLERERERADRLEAALLRPWWRRWWGGR